MQNWNSGPAYGIRVVARTEDTGGAYGLIEITVERGGGPAPHIHEKESEGFYVVCGIFILYVEGQDPVTLESGQHAFGPRGVRHHFRNIGEGPGRLIAMLTPGGGEKYFEELAEARAEAGPDLAARIEAIDKKYGMVINRP